MATIQKRNNSYKITASCGYNSSGKQLRKSITWTPSPGMTPKQIEKELERQKVMFEEKCRNGTYLDGNIKLSDYAEKWFTDYATTQLKSETYYVYQTMMKRVNQALGHIRIDRIQPHHLLEFYNNLAECGIREDIKYKPVKDIKKLLIAKKMTQKILAERSGLSDATIRSCIKGNNVSKLSAEKIMTVLNDNKAFEPIGTEKTLSGETILHHHRFISAMLSTAVEWQLIPHNPCDRVKPPKVKHKEAVYLDDVQVLDLIRCLDKAPLQYRTLVMLLLYSVMRRGEVCGLEWSDIDFKNAIVDISKSSLYLPNKGIYEDTPKNKTSQRKIKIPDDMIQLLKEHRAEQNRLRLSVGDKWQNSNKIFTTVFGSPIHPDSVSGWFRKFIKTNNLPKIHLHSLRHTNATLLIANGTNIITVAKRLGHATPVTTSNIYAHAIKTADELASEKLSDILNPIRKQS